MFYLTESDATTIKISRQDSVSSVPPTPSPVEKTAPPTVTKPDYAAGLGPDTSSTPYGDQQTSSAVSQTTPSTPITPSTLKLFLFPKLIQCRSTSYSDISVPSLSKASVIGISGSISCSACTHYSYHSIPACSCQAAAEQTATCCGS